MPQDQPRQGLWQTAVLLESENEKGLGLGVQSVLWSDAGVFAAFGEQRGNELMFAVTEYALDIIRGTSFTAPHELLDAVLEPCFEYAKKITDIAVTRTFVLNALVPLDNAAWMLYARTNEVVGFDPIFKGICRNEKLANIPLITYNTTLDEIRSSAKDGAVIFKIKLGADPDKDGDPEKMLRRDKARMLEIHKAVSDIETSCTGCGHPVYYFDANDRYDTKERLSELVAFMEENGILERTVLFEEPFAQNNKLYVGDLPVCFAADESIHSLDDLKERIALGYGAITLKTIAKTLSLTIDIAEYALAQGVQCFCADLTVNPVMVEWNKNFAARIPPIRGMRIGMLESNGAQNYTGWERMLGYLPFGNSQSGSVFTLDGDFYRNCGGIFEIPKHYLSLIDKRKRENI